MRFEDLEAALKLILDYYKIADKLFEKYDTRVEDYYRFSIKLNGSSYTIHCYKSDDPDCYDLEITILDEVHSNPVLNNNHFDEVSFHTDGNFRLDLKNKELFEYLNPSEWLTEETFFQQQSVVSFGNTDAEYWKRCLQILHKINKVI